MTFTLAAGIVLSLIGLLLVWFGLKRLMQRKLMTALQIETIGVGCLFFAAVLLLVSSNLLIYQRLVYEAPVATAYCGARKRKANCV